MRIKFKIVWFLLFYLSCNFIYCQSNKPSWIVRHPFKHPVFIENKGQFTKQELIGVGSPILYYSRSGLYQLYFTSSSLVFRYDSIVNKGDRKDKDECEIIPVYIKIRWEGVNDNSEIEVSGGVSDYFTFSKLEDKTVKSGIIAHAWEKLIYHNLYKGIDVEFFYPKNKEGIEYKVIIHPGADIADFKMHYSNNAIIKLKDSNVSVHSSLINFIDHAPTAKYADGKPIKTAFYLKNNTVSFKTESSAINETLIIDPWITFTNFDTLNHVYDINSDKYGNVYTYGGYHSYELQKYNSIGILQWSYIAPFSDKIVCGDFTVDARSGTSYIAEGIGGQIAKVNSLGLQTGFLSSNAKVEEMWRIGFDYCDNLLVTGNGTPGNYTLQASTVDTNLRTVNSINILSSSQNFRDVSLLALDQSGFAYFAFASVVNPNASLNTLVQTPLPALLPSTYQVEDGYLFVELITEKYYPPYFSYYTCSNGFNGMVANKKLLLTYDGSTLKRRKNSNGVLLDSILVSDSSFLWGGLDIDCANNIYVGKQDSIVVYDTNFGRQTAIKLPDTVYALKVGYSGQLFACGAGFVCSANYNTASRLISTSFTAPSSCAASDGTATAMLNCGMPPYTYLWNNGQTKQTATGLSAGTYTVNVTYSTCLPFVDTAMVTIPSAISPTLKITASSNIICPGSADSISITGAKSYSWSPLGGLSCSNCPNPIATPSLTTMYIVNAVDSDGCKGADTIIVIVDFPNLYACCDTIINKGDSAILQANSSVYYKWVPSTGLNCDTCLSVIANPTVTTTYTVIGTDSLGCESERILTVIVDTPCDDFEVPNVFTPNGDGRNDYFVINAEGLDKYSIIIYDRWGKIMFSSTDFLNYWNGKTQTGVNVPEGVYYYIITSSCHGNNYNKQGFVQVIR